MKSILFALILSCLATDFKSSPSPVIQINTFTKIPRDMEGCGYNLFLNKKDEKEEKYIFYSDFNRALICINNKVILLKIYDKPLYKAQGFSNKDYTVIISQEHQKATGDEDYEITSAIITIKYHSKVIWTKRVIGGGGC